MGCVFGVFFFFYILKETAQNIELKSMRKKQVPKEKYKYMYIL